MSARFLGLDLAWARHNRSGAAVLDAGGRVLEVRSDLGDDADVVAWCRRWLGSTGAIAVDMPTIVRGAAGTRRRCEAQLAADFARHHAGPYPANLGRFPDGGRAAAILASLGADGVVHTATIAAHDPRVVAFEAFPHAAAVRLFGLARVLPYKKKQRAWPDVLDAWATYRAHLAALASATPPLLLGDALPERITATRGYKQWDDAIDGVLCAYIAAYVWHWGTTPPHVRVYGDMTHGHIVVPDRRASEGSAFATSPGGEPGEATLTNF